MGDYNVLIVSARLNLPDGLTVERFKAEVEARMPLLDSAYHATAPVVQYGDWYRNNRDLTFSLITQAKYNRGVGEFLAWLKPMVVQGLGESEAWAINFSEYSKEPLIEYL